MLSCYDGDVHQVSRHPRTTAVLALVPWHISIHTFSVLRMYMQTRNISEGIQARYCLSAYHSCIHDLLVYLNYSNEHVTGLFTRTIFGICIFIYVYYACIMHIYTYMHTRIISYACDNAFPVSTHNDQHGLIFVQKPCLWT
jgi:hypothetical protein